MEGSQGERNLSKQIEQPSAITTHPIWLAGFLWPTKPTWAGQPSLLHDMPGVFLTVAAASQCLSKLGLTVNCQLHTLIETPTSALCHWPSAITCQSRQTLVRPDRDASNLQGVSCDPQGKHKYTVQCC